jgi:hypothetical protein
LADDDQDDAVVGFDAQQAVEKALKAVLSTALGDEWSIHGSLARPSPAGSSSHESGRYAVGSSTRAHLNKFVHGVAR